MSTGRVLGSFLVGAASMYLFDPRSGRRRRAVMADGVTHAIKTERRFLDKAARDLENRAHGVVEKVKHPTRADVPEEVLRERVRAVIGRAASHPGAIAVAVRDHEVTLTGPVFEGEVPAIVARVAGVAGVDAVVDLLERHRAADVPALQGGRPRRRVDGWRPRHRMMLGALGKLMFLAGHRRGGALGTIAKLGGAALALRAFVNRPLGQFVGMQPCEVAIEKTITIHAPRTLVFALCTHIKEFPRFMEHVRSVCVAAEDPRRSRWSVDGPLGIRMLFEARITQLDQDHVLGWMTTPDSPIHHSGTIHFDDVEGGTRVHIQLRYRPPGGMLGHAFAKLVGADPRSRMNDDLVRAKALLELGRTRAHHFPVSLHELATEEREALR
jgi:uncharacterized membrane protein